VVSREARFERKTELFEELCTRQRRDLGLCAQVLAGNRVHVEHERSDAGGGDKSYHPDGPADEAVHGDSLAIDGIGPTATMTHRCPKA
jgi:hypothetical protein